MYKSSFSQADGSTQDSRFDGRYTLNMTWGRETDWNRNEKVRTFNLNTRVLYLGGFRELKIDEFSSALLGTTNFDYSPGYSTKLEDYFRVDFSISIRRQRKNYTRVFALDIQNLLNRKNISFHYYDAFQKKIMEKNSLGVIPILLYRVEF